MSSSELTGHGLTLDQLAIRVRGARGHEHRIEPIVRRALALVADGLEQGAMEGAGGLDEVTAAPVTADLARSSDEQAARAVAGSILAALGLRLGAGG